MTQTRHGTTIHAQWRGSKQVSLFKDKAIFKVQYARFNFDPLIHMFSLRTRTHRNVLRFQMSVPPQVSSPKHMQYTPRSHPIQKHKNLNMHKSNKNRFTSLPETG